MRAMAKSPNGGGKAHHGGHCRRRVGEGEGRVDQNGIKMIRVGGK